MKQKMLTVFVALIAHLLVISKRASVPGSADQAGRRVPRRRTSGCHGAAPVGQDGGCSRTACDRGEPPRSRRHDRSQIGRSRGAGRLYAGDGKHEHAADRAGDLQERWLPCRNVRAGRTYRGQQRSPRRASVGSRQIRGRIDRRGEVPAGRAELRLGRDRNAAPSRGRAAEGARPDRHEPRSLSRRRSGPDSVLARQARSRFCSPP